jgi:hypothetical protein
VIKQNKTGAAVEVPIVQELHAALDLCPRGRLTFIAQADGRPLGVESIGADFRRWLRIAGGFLINCHCMACARPPRGV